MATPHVSGALALMRAMARAMTGQELKDALLKSAKVLPSLTGLVKTNGVANVAASIPYLTWDPMPPDDEPAPLPTKTPTPTPTPLATATPTPIPTPGYHVLSGVVMDSAGIRIPGASVSVSTDEPKTYVVLSDANGFFRVSDIWSPAKYTAIVTAAGHYFDPMTGSMVGDTSITLRGRSLQQFNLVVKVITSDLQPAGGVAIDGGTLGTATTDSAGLARFQAAFGASYVLTPADPRYVFPNGIRTGVVLGDVTRVIAAEPN